MVMTVISVALVSLALDMKVCDFRVYLIVLGIFRDSER